MGTKKLVARGRDLLIGGTMGLLNQIFGGEVSNPALISAAKSFSSDGTEENLVQVWNKFLKSKVLLSATAKTAKALGKVKQLKEAFKLPLSTHTSERGDNLLTVYCDTNSFRASNPEGMQAITVT